MNNTLREPHHFLYKYYGIVVGNRISFNGHPYLIVSIDDWDHTFLAARLCECNSVNKTITLPCNRKYPQIEISDWLRHIKESEKGRKIQ